MRCFVLTSIKTILSVEEILFLFLPAFGKFSGFEDFALPNNPADIYLLIVNNRNTRTRCVICSKLTIKTPERRQASLLLTLNISHTLF